MRARAAREPRCVFFLGLFFAVALLTMACGTSPASIFPEATVPLSSTPLAPPAEGVAQPLDDTHPAPPTTVRFERISVEQGLSESTVNCIFQDSKGFLWFCTQDGLNKYDGYSFRVYRPDPGRNSIAFNYVRSVCEDPAGVLWIATLGGGLDRLNLETEQFTHYPYSTDEHGPSSNWLTSLFCDQDGVLWAGTTNAGLNRFDPATNRFTRYRHVKDEPDSLSHNAVNAIYRDREGVLWIGTDGGLDRGDPVRQRFIHHQHDPNDPNSLAGNSVRAIYQDRDGMLWIGTDSGLDRFDRQTEQFIHYQHDPTDAYSLGHNSVQFIFEDREGVLWIGTENGLNGFDRKNGGFIRYQNDFSDPSSLSNNWIWSIHQDREGVLWVGTYGGGLNKYDRFSERFAHYRANPGDANSLSTNQIWSIYQDRAGMLWIGTAGTGLDRLDREQGFVTHYQHDPADPDSLSHNVVRAIIEDWEGNLWIGTDGGGLDRLDPQTERFTHYPNDPDNPHSLSDNAIRAIHEDREGALWIATAGVGLNRFDRETERFTRYTYDPEDPGSLRASSIWSLAEDQEGTLWVGTVGNGLFRFDRDTERFTNYQQNPSDVMLCIHQDRHGQLWIATFGNGLYEFDREAETFSVYTVEDGLPSNAVLGILEDDEGLLWLSTNNGLSRFDPRTKTFRNYSVSDGLQSKEFQSGAYHKSRSGEMFFGGINGFNAFYPDHIQEDNPYVPPVVLTSLTQGGEPLATGLPADSVREFTVEWPNNYFDFEFAALSYSRPQKNQYAYMLEGFDKDWIYVGIKRLGRYTNLPGKMYTLRIKGSNGEGVWNEEGAAVRVTVIPPFWQTWAFRIIVLVALVTGTVGVYRQRVRSIEARSRELEREVEKRTQEIERLYEKAQELAVMEERQRLARDLHDAVSQTLFSASLIAEAMPELWKSSPEEGEQLLEKLQQLSRGALAEMRALLMELRPAALVEASMRDLLRQLGQAVSGREGIPVTVTVDEAGELPPDVHVALYRIAQEALNNVVKHAQASQVAVSLQCAPSSLSPATGSVGGGDEKWDVRLRIRDDGLGFDPSGVSREHMGIGIMHERAASIGARLEIESELGQGTRVTVFWSDVEREKGSHEQVRYHSGTHR